MEAIAYTFHESVWTFICAVVTLHELLLDIVVCVRDNEGVVVHNNPEWLFEAGHER